MFQLDSVSRRAICPRFASVGVALRLKYSATRGSTGQLVNRRKSEHTRRAVVLSLFWGEMLASNY
jgi:hypothetical protein